MKIENVQGFGDRRNTLIIAPRTSGEDDPHHPVEAVVFFPGDVQNFESVMRHHNTNSKWKEWTFEGMVTLLQARFPRAHVVLVTPSRRVEETFSCYDNFIELDVLGSPVSSGYRHAWEHLSLLVEAALASIREDAAGTGASDGEPRGAASASEHQEQQDEKNKAEKSCVARPGGKGGRTSLSLVGFSKGCTILNQLMYELKEATVDPKLLDFIRQVEAFYWLDGGHSGTIPTYIIAQSVLREIANLKATIHVHVTPYQVKDEARPHIGEEHMVFVSFLLQFGADLKHTLHFRDEPRALRRHFEVLKQF